MLDDYHIAIKRLKQAFGLDAKDVETVISALFPDKIFPYTVWEQGYILLFNDYVLKKIKDLKKGWNSSFPTFDPCEHDIPQLHIYSDRIISFLRDISSIVLASDIEDGLNDITRYIYEKNGIDFHDDIKTLLNGLSCLEPEVGIRPFGFRWNLVIYLEEFQHIIKEKEIFLASFNFSFIAEMFIDTISVNKRDAVKHLLKCGHLLKREVKGISAEYVNMIEAMPDHPYEETPIELALPLEAVPAGPPTSSMREDASASPLTITLSSQWATKKPNEICALIQNEGHDAPVMAYYLLEKKRLNKTSIGKVLSKFLQLKPSEDDSGSTYRRRTKKFLEDAKAFTITFA